MFAALLLSALGIAAVGDAEPQTFVDPLIGTEGDGSEYGGMGSARDPNGWF